MRHTTVPATVALLAVAACPTVAFGLDLTHTTASLSGTRYQAAAASVDGKAFFAGGAGSGIATVEIYDESTMAWSTANLSLGRTALAGTAVAGKALFAGGEL